MKRDDSSSPTPRAVCALLSEPRRQYLLSRLDPGERATAEDLARRIAAWERGESPEDVDRDARRRVEISLVHHHLPRLDDHDVVEFTPRENEVVLTDDPDALRPLETLSDVG